jgi:hypothetical protein
MEKWLDDPMIQWPDPLHASALKASVSRDL